MAESKQELAADLVWRYVEFLRENEAEGVVDTFTRAELEQLVAVMETASGVSRIIGPEFVESVRAGVRARLDEVVRPLAAAKPEVPAAAPALTPAPRRSFWPTGLVPAWSLAAALALVIGMGGMLGTVGMWHRGKEVVRRVKVPVELDDVEPLDERDVHRLLPRMVRNELTPQQEKNLMWHMLVCPGCFNEYVSIRHQSPMAQVGGARLARY